MQLEGELQEPCSARASDAASHPGCTPVLAAADFDRLCRARAFVGPRKPLVLLSIRESLFQVRTWAMGLGS